MSLEVNITKKLDGFTLHANFTARSTATAILGASGCGKSMTLRCIAGIVKPDAGRIVLDGRVLFDSAQHIDLPPQQRGVGLLFQNYALFPNMTVEQNVLCGLKAEKDKAARKARCAEMLQAMRLESLAKRYPAQLSGGQQQRTALARILVGRHNILMLDEPFSALDSYLREEVEGGGGSGGRGRSAGKPVYRPHPPDSGVGHAFGRTATRLSTPYGYLCSHGRHHGSQYRPPYRSTARQRAIGKHTYTLSLGQRSLR